VEILLCEFHVHEEVDAANSFWTLLDDTLPFWVGRIKPCQRFCWIFLFFLEIVVLSTNNTLISLLLIPIFYSC
jgi:hypothetical protein